MAQLSGISGSIRKRLDRKEAAREGAIRLSRQIIRECRGAIATAQSGKMSKGNMNLARDLMSRLDKMLADFPELRAAGYYIDAGQELAEAEIFTAVIKGRALPSPDEIGVTDESYVLGLADSIGELRRLVLSKLMKDDVKGASKILNKMEEFFSELMIFDYPDALIGTKHKQDVARSLIEKSRGDLAMAVQMEKLRKRIA